MRVLYSLRIPIQAAIFSFCQDIARTHDFLPEHNWNHYLTLQLITPFIAVHAVKNPTFRKSNITREYKMAKIYEFFDDLQDLTNEGGYSEKLQRLGPPIQREDLDAGWAAIINEFGIFSALNEDLNTLTGKIIAVENPRSSDIYSQTSIVLKPENFEDDFGRYTVKCPAQSHVRNHFGFCFALNVGLIKAGKYRRRNRIPLLSQASGRLQHFSSVAEMSTLYDQMMRRKIWF